MLMAQSTASARAIRAGRSCGRLSMTALQLRAPEVPLGLADEPPGDMIAAGEARVAREALPEAEVDLLHHHRGLEQAEAVVEVEVVDRAPAALGVRGGHLPPRVAAGQPRRRERDRLQLVAVAVLDPVGERRP